VCGVCMCMCVCLLVCCLPVSNACLLACFSVLPSYLPYCLDVGNSHPPSWRGASRGGGIGNPIVPANASIELRGHTKESPTQCNV